MLKKEQTDTELRATTVTPQLRIGVRGSPIPQRRRRGGRSVVSRCASFHFFHFFIFEEVPPLFGPSQQYQKHYANDAEELERSFQTKAHSEKYMNVSDVKVTGEDGYLSRSKTIKGNNKIVKKPLGFTSEDAIHERIASIECSVCELVQGVQDYTCE